MRKILWPGLALLLLVPAVLWSIAQWPSMSPWLGDRWWSVVVLVLLGGMALWAFRPSRRDAQPNHPPQATDGSQGTAVAHAHARAPQTLLVRGASVATRCGNVPEAVLQAIGPQPSMPEPDPQWPDDQGLLRLSARCATLDVSRVTRALGEAAASAAVERPALWRALALQADALDGLQATLQQLPAHTRLNVQWTVPDHWSADERSLAQSWLKDELMARLWPDAGPVEIRLLAAVGLAGMLHRLHAESLGNDESSGGGTSATLVLACDSLIDPQHAPTAAVPGEAAAALLVQAPRAGDTSAHDEVLAQLSWPASPTSDVPPERAVHDIAAHALKAGPPTSAVGRVVSNVALAGPDAQQVLDTIVELLPELDVGERLCRIGVACGDLGCAGPLVALALGSHASRHDRAPVLLLLAGPQPWAAVLSPTQVASSAAEASSS